MTRPQPLRIRMNSWVFSKTWAFVCLVEVVFLYVGMLADFPLLAEGHSLGSISQTASLGRSKRSAETNANGHQSPSANATGNLAIVTNNLDIESSVASEFIRHLFDVRPDCSRSREQSFLCPTRDATQLLQRNNGWVCITADQLCNQIPDCPNREDENPEHCLFYHAIQDQNRLLRKIMIDHLQYSHDDRRR